MTNQFLTFAGDPGADVMSYADYSAPGFTARHLGFSTGTALSIQLNTVWRQASLMTHMLGEFVKTEANLDMLDNGTPAGITALQNHFTAAVSAVALKVDAGYLPLKGGTLTGPLIINSTAIGQLQIHAAVGQHASINLSRNAGQIAGVVAYTGTTTAGARWNVNLANADPETGANAGSNFLIARYADNGTFIDDPLSISRQTGVVNFAHSPTVNGGALPYLPLAGGVLGGQLGVGGNGINYVGHGANHFGFSWASPFITAWVDGTNVGQLATTAWVQSALDGSHPTISGFLPLTGGTLSGALNVDSELTVTGWSKLATVALGSKTDFVLYSYTGGTTDIRALQWKGGANSGVVDYLNVADNMRVWQTNGVPTMYLDQYGSLRTQGAIFSMFGRILSYTDIASNAGAVVAAIPGHANGMWTDATGLWFGLCDSSGNPAKANLCLRESDGLLVSYGNIYTTGFVSSVGAGFFEGGVCTTFIDVHTNGAVIRGGGGLTIEDGGSAAIAGNLSVTGLIDVSYGTVNHGLFRLYDDQGRDGGRGVAYSSSNPSWSMWSLNQNFAMGMWINANNLYLGYFDSNGHPLPPDQSILLALTTGAVVSTQPFHAPNVAYLREAGLTDELMNEAGALVEHEMFEGRTFIDPMLLIADLYKRIKLLEERHGDA